MNKQRQGGNATCWDEVYRAIEINEPFTIAMQEIYFCIPISANKHLSEAISNSKALKIITIQEDDFSERDWQFLAAGIVNYKPDHIENSILQLYCTQISKKNIEYVSSILLNGIIRRFRFQDVTFEDSSTFQTFCKILPQIDSRLLSFEMSTNDLKYDQIEQLNNSLKTTESKTFKNYKFFMAESNADIDIVLPFNNIFTIGTMTAFQIEKEHCLRSGIGLLNKAISLSTSLKNIIIDPKGCPFSYLKYLIKPIALNGSIRSLQFNINSYMNQMDIKKCLEIIPHIYNADRTRNSIQLNISGPSCLSPFVYKTLSDVLNESRSLSHIYFHKSFDMWSITDSLSKATNLTSLTFHLDGFFDATDTARLLKANTNISKLSLEGKEKIANNWEIEYLTEIMRMETLTDLTLHSSGISSEAYKAIEKAIYNNKTIRSFALRYTTLQFHSPEDQCDLFHEILLKNQTITSLNATQLSLRTEDHYKIFFDGLATNKTLRSLSWHLFSQSHVKLLTSALAQNNTLNSIHLNINVNLEELGHIIIELFRSSYSVNQITFEFGYSLSGKLTETLNSSCKIGLQTNEALNSVKVARQDKQELSLDPQIDHLLQLNKQRQQYKSMNTTLFIKHISMKSEVYLSLLPLEVWRNIFTFVWYPGVHINFSELIMNLCGH